MSVNHCSGPDCCEHPAELCRYVMRDGVLHTICQECGSEFDADDMPVLPDVTSVLTEPAIPGTPCGDDIGICQLTQKDDIAHRWGWL